jgi:predicted DNA-binding transcriptional regulator YafY
MNRIDRLTAILIQLQSKRVVKAQEIADRFEISLRTVYRDIRALEEAGVPIIGEAGMGYSLVEGYRLPPVMFTKEEALAFVMAGIMVESFTDKHNSLQFQSALYKVKAVLRSAEKDIVEEASQLIEIRKRKSSLIRNGQSNVLQTLLTAIMEQKVVSIDYTTLEKEENTRRAIEPVGIYYAYDQWYLIAFCHLRNAYRTFRLDRISAISLTSDKFSIQHPSLKEYLAQIEQDKKIFKAVIRVDSSICKYIKESKYNQGFVMETSQGDFTEMTFMISHEEGFARWLVTFADHVTIVQPESLQETLLGLLKKMLAKAEISQTLLT